jgi:hypothetical protein
VTAKSGRQAHHFVVVIEFPETMIWELKHPLETIPSRKGGDVGSNENSKAGDGHFISPGTFSHSGNPKPN